MIGLFGGAMTAVSESEGKMIRVEIPYLPPKELSPNSRAHWRTKATATSHARRDAYLLAITSVQGQELTRFTRAKLKVTVYVKDKRYICDFDNALASVKPFIDGCVDAQIIPDDDPSHLTLGGIEYIVSNKAPMTVLEFTEVER